MSVRVLRDCYWVDFRHNFARVRKRSPVQTLAGAKAYEAILRSRAMRGEPLDPEPAAPDGAATFAEFAAEWMETYVKANNKESEQYSKSIYLRAHLVPFFGKLTLKGITAEHVERYKALKRSKKLAERTINLHLGVLGKCLRTAVDWGRLSAFPRIAKLKVPQSTTNFLTPQDSERLLAYTRAHEPYWHNVILLALRTGLRRGEIIGLHWNDVDLERRKLTVRHSVVRRVLSAPKNYHFRYVPMTPEIREMLAALPRNGEFVFASAGSKPLATNTMFTNLARIGRKAGIQRLHWHLFRHTFASQLAASGVPLTIIKELMGHSDIKMTMRYAHNSPSLYDRAVDVLDTIGKTPEIESRGQQVGNACPNLLPEPKMAQPEIRLIRQQKSTI